MIDNISLVLFPVFLLLDSKIIIYIKEREKVKDSNHLP